MKLILNKILQIIDSPASERVPVILLDSSVLNIQGICYAGIAISSVKIV